MTIPDWVWMLCMWLSGAACGFSYAYRTAYRKGFDVGQWHERVRCERLDVHPPIKRP